jgi:hypothetical protein
LFAAVLVYAILTLIPAAERLVAKMTMIAVVVVVTAF